METFDFFKYNSHLATHTKSIIAYEKVILLDGNATLIRSLPKG